MRPNDLIWNYVVNNYLLGDDPPAFDILFWNNDTTNLPAGLHSDFLDSYMTAPFANPGTVDFKDHKLDLANVDHDSFIVAGVTDHITPWRACFRTTTAWWQQRVFCFQQWPYSVSVEPARQPKSQIFP